MLVEAQSAGLKCFVSDTITKEAQATELVYYLSLQQPASEWAQQIVEQAGYERENMYETMQKAGFDVTVQARAYENFYENGDLSEL